MQSSETDTKHMADAVSVNKRTRILDLGSGNGKLVLILAARGYSVDGIELNPLLVFVAKRAVKRAGLTDRAHIIWGSFWSVNVSRYNTIILFAIPHIMPKLEAKLTRELKPGSRVISNYFTFPHLQPVKTVSRIHIYDME